jgi:hypothetical protein
MSDRGPPPPASIEAEIAVEYWTFEWPLEVGREHRKGLSAIDPEAYHIICYSPMKSRSVTGH